MAGAGAWFSAPVATSASVVALLPPASAFPSRPDVFAGGAAAGRRTPGSAILMVETFAVLFVAAGSAAEAVLFAPLVVVAPLAGSGGGLPPLTVFGVGSGIFAALPPLAACAFAFLPRDVFGTALPPPAFVPAVLVAPLAGGELVMAGVLEPEFASTEGPSEGFVGPAALGGDAGAGAAGGGGPAGAVVASCGAALAASSKAENGWASVCWVTGPCACDHCEDRKERVALTSDAELGTVEPLQSKWRCCLACNQRASADCVVTRVNSMC